MVALAACLARSALMNSHEPNRLARGVSVAKIAPT